MQHSNRKEKMATVSKSNSGKNYKIFAAVFIGLCLLVGFVCFWFYGRVQQTVRDESRGYLEEVATRVGSNIQRVINDTYAMLNSFAHTLDISGASTFSQLKSFADAERQTWNFEDIFLIDNEGNAYDVDGKYFAMTGATYLREVVLYNNASMSPLQIINGKECAIFATPLDDMNFGGIIMASLAVTYDAENFSQVLSMSSFDNEAYSHIVSKDGTLIIRSEYESGADFGYNVFTSIDSSGLVTSDISEKYKNDIQNDKAGQIEFEMNGRREYMVYSPIPPDDWYLLTFVPVDVVNEKSNLLLAITLIIAGFITLCFTLLSITMLTSFRRHRRRLEYLAYVDEVTGGNTIERFYELAKAALEAPGRPQYALVYTNICKFKVLNENFGRTVSDSVLSLFNQVIEETLTGKECIGRLMADNFAILLRYENTELLCDRFTEWYNSASLKIDQIKSLSSLPVTEFGVYIIEDASMSFPLMLDRAKLALKEVPLSIGSRLRYAVYNDEVRAQLFRESQLEDMMEDALRNHEFQMYLQPKYRVEDQKIVGAEALARWVSTSEGMIFPNEFIPLFEKNGFVVQLDLWIFEEACKMIQTLMAEGRPLKVSVNCSRANMRDTRLVQQYVEIAAKYKVPHELIEIELTESFVLEDAELFKKVVEEIHTAGFGCSMDDFGSGYSSLNMIQDLTVDTIKLDRIFFRDAGRDSVKTESVVRSIVNLARALSMVTVAEGVELTEQVSMLRRVGCDLIQGFVFAKPMPVDSFQKLLEENG